MTAFAAVLLPTCFVSRFLIVLNLSSSFCTFSYFFALHDFWTSFIFPLLSGSTLKMLAMAEDFSTGDEYLDRNDQIIHLKSNDVQVLQGERAGVLHSGHGWVYYYQCFVIQIYIRVNHLFSL